MSAAQRIAVNVARTWVRLYTSRAPGELRATRRAEIDSDLWHHARDGQEGGVSSLVTALQIVLRTGLGVLDDLSWCYEARQQERGASGRRRHTMAFSPRQTRWMGISSIAVAAIAMLMFGIVPTLQSYFASVGIPLPLPTRIVIGMSALVTAYWWAFAAGGIAMGLALRGIGKHTRHAVPSGGAQDEDAEAATEAVLTKLEPIMIVGLGLLIGAMTLSMFLPIFDVMSATK